MSATLDNFSKVLVPVFAVLVQLVCVVSITRYNRKRGPIAAVVALLLLWGLEIFLIAVSNDRTDFRPVAGWGFIAVFFFLTLYILFQNSERKLVTSIILLIVFPAILTLNGYIIGGRLNTYESYEQVDDCPIVTDRNGRLIPSCGNSTIFE